MRRFVFATCVAVAGAGLEAQARQVRTEDGRIAQVDYCRACELACPVG